MISLMVSKDLVDHPNLRNAEMIKITEEKMEENEGTTATQTVKLGCWGQVGVAMGSPLSPVIANIYMQDFKSRMLGTALTVVTLCR